MDEQPKDADDGSKVEKTMIGKSVKASKLSRKKHKCPYPTCKASVIHLPRHMRQVHDWNKTRSSTVVGVYDLRNTKSGKSGSTAEKKKRNHPRRACPFKTCGSVVRRIHNHLTEVHKVKRDGKLYRRLLNAAKIYEPPVITIDTSSNQTEEEDSDGSEWSDEEQEIPAKKWKQNVYETVYNSDVELITSELNDNETSVYDDNGDVRNKDDDEDDNGDDVDYNGSNDEDDESESEGHNGSNGKDVDSEGENYSGEGGESKSEVDGTNSEKNDEDDESDDENGGNVSRVNTNDRVLLSNFSDWLKGPDGGRKDDKSAKQCMRHVQLVMEFINPKNPSVCDLLSKVVLREKWLNLVEKDKQPGTVKSYLGSLNQFFVFLNTECNDNFEQLSITGPELVRLSEQAKLWSRSYRKLSQDRFWEKRIEDMTTLKTPDEVKTFDTSTVTRNAVKILGDIQENPSQLITPAEYTNVRDYLMTMICINNGSRSGPIANMTISEFSNSTKERDCHVIRVKKHKTFTTHGPVHLVLSQPLYEYLNIFVTLFRNQLPAVETTPTSTIFLSWRGIPLDASQVGAQIGSCWGKVFGKDASTGGATSFRKAAVSAVQESNEELRGDLANLMVHKKSTADRYYLLQDKGKSAVRTSKELCRIMRESTTDKCKDKKKKHLTNIDRFC